MVKNIIINLLFVNSNPPMLVMPDIHSGAYTVLFSGEKIVLTACCKIKLIPNVPRNVYKGRPYKFFTTSRSIKIPTNPVNKKAVGMAINIEIEELLGIIC